MVGNQVRFSHMSNSGFLNTRICKDTIWLSLVENVISKTFPAQTGWTGRARTTAVSGVFG